MSNYELDGLGQKLNRVQRRALENLQRKYNQPGKRLLSGTGSSLPGAGSIVEQIGMISRRNEDKDLAEVSESDRTELVDLSAQLYSISRQSRFSTQNLVAAVTFNQGVNEEGTPDYRFLSSTQEWASGNLESFNLETGVIDIWMGAEMCRIETYRRYQLSEHTPSSNLVQILSHAFHHKEAHNPHSRETGFSSTDSVFNEIVTEYLRIQADRRAGLEIISSYPVVTGRLPFLQRLLGNYSITEKQILDFFNRRSSLDFALEIGAKMYPAEYRRFYKRWGENFDGETEDEDYNKIIHYGIRLIKAVEQGEY